MAHIILLGDSIFDNGVYVPGGPDVVKQLRQTLPSGWSASLLAVDGAVTRSVAAQMTRVPADATHLVLSVGGNDALGASHLLSSSVRSVGEGVLLLADAQDRFARDYEDMLETVLSVELPTTVCTIYDTPPSAPQHRIIKAALSLFNDRITRAAFSRGLPLIDLRLICNEEGDYANPIEPSVQGGAKMARAIAGLLAGTGETQAWSVVAARSG
nr:SGNH/GDSL hydrolase family protein [uncultured Sphingosinicella sp.]